MGHFNQLKCSEAKIHTQEKHTLIKISSVQSLNHVRLRDPKNCSTPGLPVHHQLPEFTQTHAHRVGDAIQPSHSLLSPSPSAPNSFQHYGKILINIRTHGDGPLKYGKGRSAE